MKQEERHEFKASLGYKVETLTFAVLINNKSMYLLQKKKTVKSVTIRTPGNVMCLSVKAFARYVWGSVFHP